MGADGFQRRTLFGTPKRKAPRSSRGGCARKCHVREACGTFFDWKKKTASYAGGQNVDKITIEGMPVWKRTMKVYHVPSVGDDVEVRLFFLRRFQTCAQVGQLFSIISKEVWTLK